MTDSELTQGDNDLQQLQAVRREQLSCLFDVDSKLQALTPPQAQPQVRQGPQKPLSFPNHNPIGSSTAAALDALGKSRRKNPGGSKRQGQPPTQPIQQPLHLPTPAELAAQYGQLQTPQQPFQGEQPQGRPVKPGRRQVTLFSLWRRFQHFVSTQPQESGKEIAQHVGFVLLGGALKFFAPSAAAVPVVVGLAVATIVLLFLFRPGWRELRLTSCLLLGLCLSSFL